MGSNLENVEYAVLSILVDIMALEDAGIAIEIMKSSFSGKLEQLWNV